MVMMVFFFRLKAQRALPLRPVPARLVKKMGRVAMSRSELETLIAYHTRHLQKLREKQALYGDLDAPVHILLQIEDTQERIDELQEQLEAASDICRSPHLQTEEINLTKELKAKKNEAWVRLQGRLLGWQFSFSLHK